jgi:hypothetical protein
MADTISINIVDRSIPAENHKNIAIVNQPNPAMNVSVNGQQLRFLVQIPCYFITDSATGKPITGKDLFEYFPDLDPHGGGGGGGDVNSNPLGMFTINLIGTIESIIGIFDLRPI